MTIRAVFFDLDGTFLDTAQDLCAALDKTMIEDGFEPLPFEVTRKSVSNGAYALLQLGFNIDREHPQMESLRERFLSHYLEALAIHTRAFDGIEPLVQQLAKYNIDWGIITNKPAVYAEPLMQHFQFASEPVCLICPDHVENRKPHPESLYLACEGRGYSADQTIYVGDHKRDIDCGMRAGAKTIAVSYGYIEDNDDIKSWSADYIVDHASEIWPLIKP